LVKLDAPAGVEAVGFHLDRSFPGGLVGPIGGSLAASPAAQLQARRFRIAAIEEIEGSARRLAHPGRGQGHQRRRTHQSEAPIDR
jgi:hypothetical protein